MLKILSVGCDSLGHCWLALALALGVVAPAAAADYTAKRYDVVVAISEDGDLHVRERILFEFQSGTFKRVWREIPASRTDGIEIVEAQMDGAPLTPGDGPGHFTVSGDNRVRVEWQFAPIGPSQHTFDVHYIARGVVYRDGDRDVLRWRLLPSEHRYSIEESVATIAMARGPIDRPKFESRRVDALETLPHRDGMQITARGIGSNGWVIAELRFEAGTIVTAIPQWQQRQQHAASLAPAWGLAAASAFVAGLLLVLALRGGYSKSTIDLDAALATAPPESLPAAIAAVLASKGRTSGQHSTATLLDLADRGVLRVAELPRRFGVRTYEISQVAGRHDLDAHELEALQIAFGGASEPVTFARARGRLARGSRRFTVALNRDLASRGLLDPDRKRAQDRLTIGSMVLLLGGALGCVAAAAFVPRFDGWPFLIPLGLVASGIVGIVMASTMTPLSDEGLLKAAEWRGFKRHLKRMADAKEEPHPDAVDSRWIVYGIAVGLAYQFARFLKRHPGAAPDWFIASPHDDGAAFAAFVGSQAASHGGGGGGGAAAGGGSSGAG
jgi:hypothetical protein